MKNEVFQSLFVYIKKRNVTLKKAALESGLSEVSIQKHLHRKRRPNKDSLKIYSTYLDIPFNVLKDEIDEW